MAIKKILTKRAERWLFNHCQTETVYNDDSENGYERPRILNQFVKTVKNPDEVNSKVYPVILNRYTYVKNDNIVVVEEFIDNVIFNENRVKVQAALRFKNPEKNQVVVCSLFDYIPTNVKQTQE
jgi:hypothetical protein